ncbi:FeoC-like transcriptional regulator [Solemya elarraichensis gill symbiont]|uniref:Sugar metabolism transcriptional regulator n=1 Tax=Solemya elarraichensis gill symbiont TaxID=1918949 RepID=A0A1T2L5Y8_9GAMM|nr:FeoC-like transcriptional regulator [Solemya elarraichensis gill symbiont]OOZ40356.1 sugar metabolism transcriptional regulator [Solemya elarraichensis gill symbiont]
MILSEVREYVKERGRVTLADIVLHFDSDPESVRPMLEIWIKKGKIRKEMLTSACGSSCNACDTATTEIYTWNGPKAA